MRFTIFSLEEPAFKELSPGARAEALLEGGIVAPGAVHGAPLLRAEFGRLILGKFGELFRKLREL